MIYTRQGFAFPTVASFAARNAPPKTARSRWAGRVVRDRSVGDEQIVRLVSVLPMALVSVVTPVYNGAKYLRECIESVLAQSYGDLEHVILDNASSDETRDIAEEYARADRRIRIFANERTVPMVENWNRALEKVAADSRYCQTLHADDLLYPECLARMVALAERHEGVGVVGSLRRRGDDIQCRGLPEDQEVFDGAYVASLYLREEVFALAPTSGMVRTDIVRAHRPYFPTHYLHTDLAAYFEILDRTRFGFVHDVLAFSRTHAESITSTLTERKRTLMRDWLMLLREYGPRYFPPDELAALERGFVRRYHRVLVRETILGAGPEFRAYHLEGLRAAGFAPGLADLARAVVAECGAIMAQPHRAFLRLRGKDRRPGS
jgi:glycosyltransferase involved in cell wall biosynthesis